MYNFSRVVSRAPTLSEWVVDSWCGLRDMLTHPGDKLKETGHAALRSNLLWHHVTPLLATYYELAYTMLCLALLWLMDTPMYPSALKASTVLSFTLQASCAQECQVQLQGGLLQQRAPLGQAKDVPCRWRELQRTTVVHCMGETQVRILPTVSLFS